MRRALAILACSSLRSAARRSALLRGLRHRQREEAGSSRKSGEQRDPNWRGCGSGEPHRACRRGGDGSITHSAAPMKKVTRTSASMAMTPWPSRYSFFATNLRRHRATGIPCPISKCHLSVTRRPANGQSQSEYAKCSRSAALPKPCLASLASDLCQKAFARHSLLP